MEKYFGKFCLLVTFVVMLFSPMSTKAESKEQTPVLKAYRDGNSVKLEWAVEMLDEDILYKTGFETGDLLPNLSYSGSDKVLPDNRKYGGQSFTTEEKYSGLRSLKIVDSYSNGNVYHPRLDGGYTLTGDSWADFMHQRFYIANSTDLSLSFRAKTTGEGIISFLGVGGPADYGTPMDITFLQDVKVGDRTVKVSDVYFFKDYVDKGERFYLALSKGRYNYGYVIDYDITNSTITLNRGFEGTFEKGDNVLRHYHRNPVSFNKRTIKQQDGWMLMNLNTKVANYLDYNTLNRGFRLAIKTRTHDTVYIDDVKLGYATRTQLFRNGEIIYDGYLSDYKDKEAVDKTKPNKVTDFHVMTENKNTYLQIVEPRDNGTTYNYMVRAISNNGGAIYDSEIQTVNVISGIKGYSYLIDDNPNTTPNGNINSTDGKIKVPITAGSHSYLHIQAVDHEGNKSDVSHIPLKNVLEETFDMNVPKRVIMEKNEMYLNEQPKILKMSFDSNVTLENYHPSLNSDWELSVWATQLEKVDEEFKLPKGTLKISPVLEIKTVGETTGVPELVLKNKTVLDDGKVTVLRAKKDNGIGKYEVVFPEHAVEAVIDPTIAKAGKYRSVIVWELSKTPTSNN